MARILIIDDNDAILHVLKRVLEKHGYKVDDAGTGREALEKITTTFYDLAIVDLNLPDINGQALYKMISTRSPKTKKIILTGLPPIEPPEDMLRTEQIDYLLKPLSGEELIQAVKKKLENNEK